MIRIHPSGCLQFTYLPIKVIASNVHHSVLVLLHPQEGLTIVAAIILELLHRLKLKFSIFTKFVSFRDSPWSRNTPGRLSSLADLLEWYQTTFYERRWWISEIIFSWFKFRLLLEISRVSSMPRIFSNVSWKSQFSMFWMLYYCLRLKQSSHSRYFWFSDMIKITQNSLIWYMIAALIASSKA